MTDKQLLENARIVASLESETEHLKQLLWAVVQAAGGQVSVPYSTWTERTGDIKLVMSDDTTTMTIKVQAVRDA